MTPTSRTPVDAGPARSAASSAIAVMQPYFIPYAGYFRLFAASDLFVIYDCVQFPRRGWVHRNRLVDQSGNLSWLTLPLEKAPRDILIRDLRFSPDAAALIRQRVRPFGLAAQHGSEALRSMIDILLDPREHPVDYIARLLECAVACLGLPWNVIRSSSLNLPDSLRGQDRILEIARRLGARRYVNPPGGRSLYDPAAFADAGIELRFLPEYSGPASSILARFMDEDRAALAEELRATIGRLQI
jgi:hypothetical protein